MTKTQKKPVGVLAYFTLSAIASVFVGVLVYFGTRKWDQTIIWSGLTFIVVIVGIATLSLSIKDDDFDGSTPRLVNKTTKN